MPNLPKLRNFALYRVFRVAAAVTRVLPRYLALLAREQWTGRPAGELRWERAHLAGANQIHRLGVDLAGLFVKVGQIIGARADVLPAIYVERARCFHDDVPPRPFAELRAALELELRAPLESRFPRIDENALAAASLAQVHRAWLPDGTAVVLKIQYPEIDRLARVDLASVRRVARLVSRLQQRIDFRSLVEEVARFIALELDFGRELRSTETFARSLAADAEVRVPRVFRDLCSEKLLVLEYLDGIQVSDLAALREAGHDLEDVARRIARLYCSMVFESGEFHGDPHPGNLLVLSDGRIGLIDFGLCKRLPASFAKHAAALVVHGLRGDGPATRSAASALGFDVDSIAEADVVGLVRALLGQGRGGAALPELLEGRALRQIPSDFALVARTLILLNGLSHTLAPGRHVMQTEMLKVLTPHLQAAASSPPAAAAR